MVPLRLAEYSASELSFAGFEVQQLFLAPKLPNSNAVPVPVPVP